MILLETYSALEIDHLLKTLPKFLNIQKEVTGNPHYSMYNLSLREDWKTSKKFCRSITGPEDSRCSNKTEVKVNGHVNGIDYKCHGVMNGKAVNGKA
ncbi:hypothetical protein NQ318_009037 [Aromia moschata]|uniref:Uncharacterized protein n=1 Tax=Aromia moschata TaxID=1265417 RepID=A0AAV8YVI9_9CUCU|nr:hypothetical protein NQ318_009037 [Aromia moschata]